MSDKADIVEKTLDAANSASSQARNMWLGFLGLLAYLFIALASVTHKDLLLNSPVQLPIVNVELPLFSFFLFGPFLLILFHFGLLMQHVTLSRKLAAFEAAIDASVRTRGRSADKQKVLAGEHAARLRLHGYSITQNIAGPANSWIVKGGQWLMGWLTLNLLPLVVLLYFQIQFLPYHDHLVTWLNRGAIIADLVLLIGVGMFIDYPVSSVRAALARNFRRRYVRTSLVLFGAMIWTVLSVCVATIPDGAVERFLVRCEICITHVSGRKVFRPTAYFFEGRADLVTGKAESWFSRNLIVTDTDLVVDDNSKSAETSHSLRGRDFRYARLDRSDLHRADLTGANLSKGSLGHAKLSRSKLSRARLQSANLRLAALRGADLRGVELQGADLRLAELQGANLRRAELQGANLGGAELQGADLGGAQLQGADLRLARLQGADMRGAKLQGARLRGAKLQGADLGGAKLRGGDLRRAELQGAELRGAAIWQTNPPASTAVMHADLRDIVPEAPDANAVRSLNEMLNRLQDDAVRQLVTHRIARLLKATDRSAWESREEFQAWVILIGLPRSADDQVSAFLAALACGDDRDGYVAKGIARRALAFTILAEPLAKLLAEALLANGCEGAKSFDDQTRWKLRDLAERNAEPSR